MLECYYDLDRNKYMAVVDHESPGSKDSSTSMVMSSIAGGAAAGIAKTCMAPLERVRIIRQASERRGGSFSLLKSIYREEGIRGLWKGNGVNLARVVPSYAVRFSVFGHLSDNEMFKNPFIAGCISGLASALASYPLEVLRTRMSVGSSLWEAFAQGRLYSGCSLTVLETMPYAGLTLGTYNYMRNNFSLTSGEDLWTRTGCGLLSGFVATLVCFPLDTLRRNKMVRPTESIPFVFKSLKSLSRFYRGLSVALVKSAPTVALTMLLNDVFIS